MLGVSVCVHSVRFHTDSVVCSTRLLCTIVGCVFMELGERMCDWEA